MKKSLLLFATVISVSVNTFAQDCEYEEYYPLVEAAAEDFSNKKYKEAHKKLKLAFSKTEFPLGEHLNLALKVAEKQNDSQWAGQIAIALAKGGVPLRFFRKLKNHSWYKDFEKDFPNYANHYQENYNPQLREALNALLQRDKEFNRKYHQWRTKQIEMTLEELIEGATEIYTDFKKMTDAYGFPNERSMGFNYVKRKDRVEYYKTDALMIHIYQRGVLFFEDEIHTIVCEGGLHPNYETILKKIRGLGNSTGVEQEMRARYATFREN